MKSARPMQQTRKTQVKKKASTSQEEEQKQQKKNNQQIDGLFSGKYFARLRLLVKMFGMSGLVSRLSRYNRHTHTRIGLTSSSVVS